MATPDAALGINAAFDSEGFRNAIKFAMQMGAPPDPDKRPKFVRRSTARTYWKDDIELTEPPRMGRDNEPLDPDIEVRTAADEVVEVDCAIEIDLADADELPVGNFRETKATVTFLDVDYAQIDGCKEMTYNGDRYVYGYEPEAPGLFDVGVHSIIFYCLDES